MARLLGRDQREAETALEALAVHGIAVCDKPERGLPLYRIAPTRLVWHLVEAHLLLAA
jgi:hypothetical protein